MQDSNRLDRNKAEAHTAQPTGNFQGTLRSWQQTLIRAILRVVSVLSTLTLAAAIYNAVAMREYWQIGVAVAAYLVLLIVTFVPGTAYGIQVGVILFLVYLAGVFNLTIAGQTGNGIPVLLAVPVLAVLFAGRRAGIGFTILVISTVVLFAILFVTGVLSVPKEAISGVDDAGSWISRGLVFALLATLMTIPQYTIFQRFTTTILQEQQLTSVLESERANLEERVAERTEAATRRARYLEAFAIVAREAAGVIEDSEELLLRVVNLISEQFGFYHTGLFLNDEGGDWAELKAASSEGGQRMLASGHRLLIGFQGIVGYVAQRGQPRIALDVGDDAVFFDNPNLPDTRSEIALPLQVRGQVIGVLDVQSTERQAFEDDDIAVLQSIADQVALAISNARLFTMAQESIEAERRIRGDLSLDGWYKLLQTEQDLSARSTQPGVSSAGDVWFPEMGMALQGTEPVIDSETQVRIAIPVRVAGQTIGVVAARKSPSAGHWSSEEVGILTTLTEQLNAAVERARLYRQAQLVASREQTITEVGARLRASLQMETILQTAVREIGQAMGLDDLTIELHDLSSPAAE